jgi:HAD superfamily hydrolase (TIGR01484 family)
MGEHADRPVVCLDFDGTLVDDEGRIHPADVEILATEHSVAFVPATGRPLHSVRRAFERHGLFSGRPIPFPLVLENGAAVYGEREHLRSRRSLQPELRDELLRAALSAKEANFLLHSLNEARTLGSNDLLRAFVRRFDLDARPWDPDSDPAGSWERPLVKLVVTAEDPKAVGRFEAETADLPLERTYSLPNMLELGPAGVHKGSGLATLLDHTGHAPREVVVAGDGENDLALFEMATLRFAPADSPPAIRARADRILDVQEEGLLAPILREIGRRATGRRVNPYHPGSEAVGRDGVSN